MDYGHKWTDKELKKLEKRISAEYTKAAAEMQKKVEKYYADFARKDEIKRKEVSEGKISQSEYTNWRRNQMLVGKRWEEMQANLAQDMHTVNMKTASMTRQFSYDAYAMNFNYGTFEAESGSGIDTAFTLYDRSTVERLIRDDPDMLPPPGKKVSQRIREGKDVLWNKQVIQSVMTQSILQGESIPNIATRLAEAVGDTNRKAAIRNARTMTTGAENAGREDSYKRAESMGIKMQQMWIATLDGRTRHEHRQLDGQKRKVGEPFEVSGQKIMFPGDPKAAPYLVWNCRCTLIGIVANSDVEYYKERMDERATIKGYPGMTYEEWKNEHSAIPTSHTKGKSTPDDIGKPTEISISEGTPTNPEYIETPIPPKPEFVPANSIEEAEAFISKYVDSNQFGALGVSYKGINLDAANEINKALSELFEMFDVGKIGGIVAPAKNTKLGKDISDATAGYMPIRNSFLLNRDSLKSVSIAEKRLKEEKEILNRIIAHPEKYDFSKLSRTARETIQNSIESGRSVVAENISDTIRHEFGHMLEKQIHKHPLWGQVRNDMQLYSTKISGYATTDSSEYIAESFASWMRGEKNVDPNLITIFESLKRGV
jgi:hypothetical protein